MQCEICGKEIEESAYGNKPLCSDECFVADYWLDRVKDKNDKRQVIIDHDVYYIEPENDTSSFRGYDGAKFIIHFLDGRKVYTTNLWHNGIIPKAFRDLLPNNAVFGTIEDYNKNRGEYETY